jgi:glycosyltransferase involved in cell wall biosynthesis
LKTCDAPQDTAQSRRPSVGIITHVDMDRAAARPLDNLITILDPLANKLFLITGGDYDNFADRVQIIRTSETSRTSLLSKVLEQVVVGVRIANTIFKLRDQIDVLLFFNGAGLAAPLVFARCLNIKCIVILTYLGAAPVARAIRESGAEQESGELMRLRMLGMLERVSYFFANELIVYSPSMVEAAGLHGYRTKTTVAHRHFLNFDEFRFEDNVEHRDNVVGYIGRLKEEKGILTFVEAIPKVLEAHDDATFLIVGEGVLEDRIRRYVHANGLDSKVELTGWIPHGELPSYLYRMKLLALPSYNEGLPNVMLESMACGTPVIATPVGSIPDVVVDGENGFLINENSSTALAERITEALQRPQLQRIAVNARMLVETEFRYERLIKTWERIICDAKDV